MKIKYTLKGKDGKEREVLIDNENQIFAYKGYAKDFRTNNEEKEVYEIK